MFVVVAAMAVVLDENASKYQVKFLDDENYFNWSFRMETILRHKELWTVIVDEKPDSTETAELSQWEKKNSSAVTCIRLSVDDSQIKHIRGIESAKDAWKALKQVHERDTPGNKMRLLTEIVGKRAKDGDDIAAHVNAMTEMFQRLLALGKFEPEFMLCATLLNSLPRSYDGLVLAIQSRKEEEIDISSVKSIIMEEYRRRSARDSGAYSSTSDAALKVVGGGKVTNNSSHKKLTCHFCKKPGHFKRDCSKYEQWKSKKGDQPKHTSANVVQQSSDDREYLFVMGATDGWILDSGATCHVSCDRSDFIELNENHKESIKVANGDEVTAVGKGKISLCMINDKGELSRVVMHDVLFVPSIKTKLVSVKRLAEKGLRIKFSEKTCEIRSPDNVRQIATGYINSNLYTLKTEVQQVNVTTQTQRLCVHDWHRVLGHRDIQVIKDMPLLVDGMKIVQCGLHCEQNCQVCIKGKMTHLPFPVKSRARSAAPLDLIHSDICGPMQTQTPQGKRYILTFIDDFSKYTTVYLLREKSEAFTKFKEFYQLTQNQFERRIRAFRSDRGGEYTGELFVKFLEEKGIRIERSAPQTPQQNGVAERKNRTLVEMARCMLADAHLENSFWGEAVMSATFIQNRVIWKGLTKTPFELWFGRKPNYANLGIFGTKCYVKVQDGNRRKFDMKAVEARLMGHDMQSKAYRCYVPSKGTIVISRDVKIIQEDTVSDQILKNDDFKAQTPQNGKVIEFEADERLGKPKDDVMEDEQVVSEDENEVRRSKRLNIGVPPSRYRDICLAVHNEPSSYNDVVTSNDKEKWMAAMKDEMDSLEKNETWELVPLPPGKNLVGCKWVYKIKTDAEGKIQRHKARLVAQGFSQKFGVDYDQVFAPVARQSTFRILLSVAAGRNMRVFHFDAKTAFLNGELQEEIYMKQPPGFVKDGKEDLVCKLRKSIYGLKQSARVWNETLHKVLIELGLKQASADDCLYVLEGTVNSVYVLVYVDDILVTSNSDVYVERVRKKLQERFITENLGEVRNYLGMRIERSNDGMFFLDQRKYIQRIIEQFELQNAKGSDIPLNPTYYSDPCDDKMANNSKYRSAIGCLLYVAMNTRPDIAAAVGILSQKVSEPTIKDWKEVKRVICYLKSTIQLRLKIGCNDSHITPIGYSDANWAECRNTRKSNSGCIFKLGGPIIWYCRRQDSVALSSSEAEYIALSEACKEGLWLQRLLQDFSWKGGKCITIYEDNQNVLTWVKTKKPSGRSKHIDTRLHFIGEHISAGRIKLIYCPTAEMVADIFTKGLPKDKFVRLRKLTGLDEWN